MTVTRILTPDYFRPNRRIVTELEWRKGMRLSELAPESDGKSGCVYWLNGAMVTDGDSTELRDGDFVQAVVVPEVEAYLALHWAYQLLIAVAVLATTTLVSQYLIGDLVPPDVDPQGSANNGFSGFRNTYEQGAVLPLVYGRHRVAGVCINQQIGAVGGAGVLTQTEYLRTLYALSEGPIYGIGKYLGPVGTQAERNAMVISVGGSVAEKAGVQINGQVASNFNSVGVNWRTGEDSQEKVSGYDGTTDIVTIEQSLRYLAGIDNVTFPPGVYDSASDIAALASGDSVSYQATRQYDRARIQFLFSQGIFKTSGGSSIPSTAKFRIQYWSTDSGGTRIDDTIVLPEVSVTGNLTVAAVFDIEFTLFAASGYVAPLQLGYYKANAGASDYLSIEQPLSPLVLPSSYQDQTAVRWSVATWMRPVGLTAISPSQTIFCHFAGGPTPGVSTEFPYSLVFSGATFGWSFRLVAAGPFAYLAFDCGSSQVSGTNTYQSVLVGLSTSLNQTWHHVGMTYEATPDGGGDAVVRMYFDGVEVTVNPTSYLSGRRGHFTNTAELFFGRGPSLNANVQNKSTLDICTLAFFDGAKSPEYFVGAFGDTSPIYGLKSGIVPADEEGLIAGLNVTDFLSSPKLANIAQGLEESTTDGKCFEASDVTAIRTQPQSDAPVYSVETGVPLEGYYSIEVFRSNVEGNDSTIEQNEATVEQITLLLDEVFEYPQTATIDVALVADEQVNNQRPLVTALVYGKLCKIWDGLNEKFPTFTTEWTRNPAWIAMDMLSNPRYGLGGQFPLPSSYDLPSWLEWADHCEEGVEDGFGTQEYYGGEVYSASPLAPYGQVQFNIPLIDADGDPTSSVIPSSWAVGKTLGIKTASSQGAPAAAGAWVSVDVDAKLPIVSITYNEDSAAPDGYTFWATIICDWSHKLPLPNATGDVTGTVVGFEPRCLFDGIFDQANAAAWDQVISVFQAGRAMPILVGNRLSVFVDRKRPPVALLTMANCIEDSFKLQWTGRANVSNSFEVNFLDELANYEEVTIQVDHSSVQDAASFETFRKERAKFVGVVRRSQAIRDANFRLNQGNTLLRACQFKLGLDGIPLLPGDRIRVAHDTPKYGVSGRLLAGPEIIGNFNIYPEAFAQNLIQFGGLLDVDNANLEVAGVPTAAAASGDYQDVGPLGHGSAELIRNTSRGSGQDDATSGATLNVGSTPSLDFYASSLLPGGEAVSVLGFIEGEDWELTAACFVKEPDVGASDVLRCGIYVKNGADGGSVEELFVGYFKWTAGVLASVGAPTGNATVTVQAPGTTGASAGWYRVAVHMQFSDLSGGSAVEVGDPYSVIFSPAYFDEASAGTFEAAALGGKGVNFAKDADPLDFSSASWVHTGTTSTALSDATLPPFYVDADHGAVQSLISNAANGTTQFVKQTVTIQGAGTTFGGSGTVAGEDFTATLCLKEGTGTVTRVQLINPSGESATVDITWATHGTSVTGSAGAAATFAAVYQNSTTTDADWYQLDLTFTNASGDSTYDVRIFPHYVGSGGVAKSVEVWGLRTHGDSDNGTSVNPYPHRGMYLWGLDVHPSYAIQDYAPGTEIALGRHCTFEAGGSYEVEVRSSLVQASGGGPVVESVAINPTEVPSSGSTLVTAGTFIKTAATFRTFQAGRGDLYSIGNTGTSVVDFTIVSINMNPTDLTREVTAVEYSNSIYDEVADTSEGTVELLTFSSGESPTAGGYAVPATAFYGAPPAVREANTLSSNGEVTFAVIASWSLRGRGAGSSVGGVRIYVAQKDSSTSSVDNGAQMVAEVRGRVRSYTISNYPWEPGQAYRVFFQAVGLRGNARSIASCPFTDFVFYGGVPRRDTRARVAASTARGERTLMRVLRTDTTSNLEPTQYEVRVGGWRLGQRMTNVIGGQGDISDEMFTGPTNAAGEGAPPLFVRGLLGRGQFGLHTRATMSAGITGSSSLLDVPYEDDWTDAGGAALTGMVLNSDNHLEFTTVGSGATGEWTSKGRSLTYARRVYVEFWAEAELIPSMTIGDLDGWPLGSPRFYHWTLEGPISGPDFDGVNLEVLWDHSETGSLSGDFESFRPGVVFMHTAKFKIRVDRTTDLNAQVKIKRAGLRIIEMSSYRADGGEF